MESDSSFILLDLAMALLKSITKITQIISIAKQVFKEFILINIAQALKTEHKLFVECIKKF